MPQVLLIDDDKESMKYYEMAMRLDGYDIGRAMNPDEAMEYVTHHPEPDIVILDIMLPPGDLFAENPECDQGLRTGILLYPELRQHYGKVPFIVLTNLRNPDTIRDFSEIAPNVPVHQKIDTPPQKLLDMLRKMVPQED